MLSGTYTGTLGGIRLVLRVDIDGPRPLKKVSGDIFGLNNSGQFYIDSFIVNEPQVTSQTEGVLIEGSANFSQNKNIPYTIQVAIPKSQQSPEAFPTQAFVYWYIQNNPYAAFACAYASPSFRAVYIESSFEDKNTLPSLIYNTHSADDRPPDLPKKDISINGAYAEAGVQLFEGATPVVLQGWEAGLNAGWSDAELQGAMQWHFNTFANVPQWRLFLLFVRKHEMSGYIGLMFDSGDEFQRQGCAVFSQHSYLTTGTPGEQSRALLWAAIHETGHCFNLLHSFDKGPGKVSHPDDLSWMNYPYLYDKLPGKQPESFWKEFPFQFTDGELLHLRHAELYSIIMGGRPLLTGSGAEYLEGKASIKAPRGSELSLRVEAKTDYEFGEPVFIELSLRPPVASNNAITAYDALRPSINLIEVYIKKPSGQVVLYKPLLLHNIVAEEKVFAAGETPSYESVYIGYGKDGFYFSDPGTYEVIALYKHPDGGDLVSNIVSLKVASPPPNEERQFVNNLLGDEQGLIFYLDGSDYLARGSALLQDHILRKPNGPVARHIHRVLGTNAARTFKFITPQKKLEIREPNLEVAVRQLSSSLQLSAVTGRSHLDNITYNKAAILLAETQLAAGRDDQARSLVENVTNYFASQGIRKDVLRSIRTSIKTVLGADEYTEGESATRKSAPKKGTSRNRATRNRATKKGAPKDRAAKESASDIEDKSQ